MGEAHPRIVAFPFEGFHAPKRRREPPPPPPPDPRALERARADGIQEGEALAQKAFAESVQKTEQDRREAEARALSAAAAAFEQLQDVADLAAQHTERAIARLAAACLQRLVADLGEGEAHRRAAAFAREIAQAAAEEPTLSVRAGAEIAQIAHDALARSRAADLTVTVDRDLPPYALSADWETGRADYDAMADVAFLEDVIAQASAALAPVSEDPASTGETP